LQAEAQMRDYGRLRERLEEACASAAFKRGAAAPPPPASPPASPPPPSADATFVPPPPALPTKVVGCAGGGGSSRGGAAGEAEAAACDASSASVPADASRGGGVGEHVQGEGGAGGRTSNASEREEGVGARASGAVSGAAQAAKATAAAAAEKTKAGLEAAAALAESASAHVPQRLRGALHDLYSRSKAVADSAAASVAETAGEMGGGLGKLGQVGPSQSGFSMHEALKGLNVALGGADLSSVRQVAGEGSGLALLLQRLEDEIREAHQQRQDAEKAAALLEDETLCLMSEVQQLEGDLQKAADRHGVELLGVYETMTRLEAALGEQKLDLDAKHKALIAAETRATKADKAVDSAHTALRDLESLKREADALVAAWNASSRAPTLPAENAKAALSIMRDTLGKDKGGAGSKVSPRGGAAAGSSPRAPLKGYIAEMDSAGGPLLSPAAAAAGTCLPVRADGGLCLSVWTLWSGVTSRLGGWQVKVKGRPSTWRKL
jgi:hypothetical protein